MAGRILVVGNDGITALDIEETLAAHGYEVATAVSVKRNEKRRVAGSLREILPVVRNATVLRGITVTALVRLLVFRATRTGQSRGDWDTGATSLLLLLPRAEHLESKRALVPRTRDVAPTGRRPSGAADRIVA